MWFFGKFYLVQVARKTLSPNYNWTSVSEVCSQRVFVCVCLPIDYKVASLKLFPRINRHYVYFRKFPSFVACSVLAATKWELQAVAVAADSVSLTSVNAILFRIKFNQIELLLPITTGRPSLRTYQSFYSILSKNRPSIEWKHFETCEPKIEVEKSHREKEWASRWCIRRLISDMSSTVIWVIE